MRKKIIIIILVIFLIVIGTGFIIHNDFKHQKIKIGDIYFDLPQGYHKGNLNEMGHVNITDGNHSIFITSINSTNTTEYVTKYVSSISRSNQTIILSNFTIDSTFVYKTTNKQTGANHYWFVEKNKLYTIYNWEHNPQMDDICKNLIRSAKLNN